MVIVEYNKSPIDIEEENALKNKLLHEYPKLSAQPNFGVTKYTNNVFAVTIDGLNYIGFYDGNGELLLNIEGRRTDPDFDGAQVESGFKEVKNNDGTYDLYRIINIRIKDGKVVPELGEKIDKYSLRYFEAWKHIQFSEDRIYIKTIKGKADKSEFDRRENIRDKEKGYKLINEKGYYYVFEFELEKIIKSGALRLRDLVKFFQNKQLMDEETANEIKKIYAKKDEEFKQIDENINGKINSGTISQSDIDRLKTEGESKKQEILKSCREQEIKLADDVNKKLFTKYYKQLGELLFKQIGDKRFENVNDPVTKEEINQYRSFNLISEEMKNELLKLIDEMKGVDRQRRGELNLDSEFAELQQNIVKTV